MKVFVLIVCVGLSSYWFSDIKSSGFFDGFLFPLIFGLSVLAAIFWVSLWLVSLPGGKSGAGGDSGGGCFSLSDSGGGGDGGCGGGD